jgi:streptogramin lyase
LNNPSGIAVDSSGNIYIADTSNHAIRKVNASDGKINTIAGTIGSSGSTGDGGLATSAKLSQPAELAIDANGNIIFSSFTHVVRKISASDSKINTIAGTANSSGSTGDAGLATAALLKDPRGIAVDSSGNIYIADYTNHAIRKVNVSDGKINTIAGTIGSSGSTGDGGLATAAKLNGPGPLSIESSGNIYIGDTLNNAIRKFSQTSQSITFATPSAQTVGTSLTISASSSSSLALTYSSSTTGICTVSGSTLTFVADGTCTIIANG